MVDLMRRTKYSITRKNEEWDCEQKSENDTSQLRVVMLDQSLEWLRKQRDSRLVDRKLPSGLQH